MSDRRASRKVRVLSLSLMGLKQWDSGGKMVSKEGNKDRTPASYFWLCGVWESCVVSSTQLLQVLQTQLVANSEMCAYTHWCGGTLCVVLWRNYNHRKPKQSLPTL